MIHWTRQAAATWARAAPVHGDSRQALLERKLRWRQVVNCLPDNIDNLLHQQTGIAITVAVCSAFKS